jgi:hypothetical protein
VLSRAGNNSKKWSRQFGRGVFSVPSEFWNMKKKRCGMIVLAVFKPVILFHLVTTSMCVLSHHDGYEAFI